jgi:prepilin-type N-terminal cleavage/methylation domain-containing protein
MHHGVWQLGEDRILNTTKRQTQAGLTLIEVVIAVAVLAVAMAGVFGAIMICFQMNTRAREDSIALSAAQDMLAQIRNTVFENVPTTYDGMTFPVPGLAPPSPGVDPGEVVIIRDETPDESVYCRDLEAPAGPDGVDLNGDGDTWDILDTAVPGETFPLDLNREDGPVSDEVALDKMKVIPVVVLVRWRSRGGLARMQLVSVVVDRDGL